MGAIAVLGAAGAVGAAIVRCLHTDACPVIAVTRRPNLAFPEGVEVRAADLDQPESLIPAFAGVSAAVLVPGVFLSVRALPALQANGVARVLAFSSHNLSVPEAGEAYQPVAQAEDAVRQSGLAWTVLRPTLIYGHPELAAGAALIRLARRMPVMVTPGLGRARQQPVFFEDLARVAAWAIRNEAAVGRVIPVGGPEIIRLSGLYAAASRAAGGTGVVVPAPLALIRVAASCLGPRFPLGPAQIARVSADKHVQEQVDLPEDVRPRVGVAEGFRRLAKSLP